MLLLLNVRLPGGHLCIRPLHLPRHLLFPALDFGFALHHLLFLPPHRLQLFLAPRGLRIRLLAVRHQLLFLPPHLLLLLSHCLQPFLLPYSLQLLLLLQKIGLPSRHLRQLFLPLPQHLLLLAHRLQLRLPQLRLRLALSSKRLHLFPLTLQRRLLLHDYQVLGFLLLR